jgi:hypothetical protein
MLPILIRMVPYDFAGYLSVPLNLLDPDQESGSSLNIKVKSGVAAPDPGSSVILTSDP